MPEETPSGESAATGPLDPASPVPTPNDRRRKSPQEKKSISYKKDRRNTYGENPAASRKGIRFRKRQANSVNRRDDRQTLDAAAGVRSPESEEVVQEALTGRRRKRWKKHPDQPLGEVLERRRSRGW